MVINSLLNYKSVIGEVYTPYVLIVGVSIKEDGTPDAFYYCPLNSKASYRISLSDVKRYLEGDWKSTYKAILCCDNTCLALLDLYDKTYPLLRYYELGDAVYSKQTVLSRIEQARKDWARNSNHEVKEDSILFRPSVFSDDIELLLDSAEYSSIMSTSEPSTMDTDALDNQLTFDEVESCTKPYDISILHKLNNLTINITYTQGKSELLSGFYKVLKPYDCNSLIRSAIDFKNFISNVEQSDRLKLFYNFLLLFSYILGNACSIKLYYSEVSKLNVSEMGTADFMNAIMAIFPLPIASLLLYILIGE